MQSGQDHLAGENLNNEWRLCSMLETVYEVTVGDVKVKIWFLFLMVLFLVSCLIRLKDAELSENIRLLLRPLRKYPIIIQSQKNLIPLDGYWSSPWVSLWEQSREECKVYQLHWETCIWPHEHYFSISLYADEIPAEGKIEAEEPTAGRSS